MSWYSENDSYQQVWRPVSIADVDRYSVSWSRRLAAQEMLDEMSFEHQKTAASCALGRPARDTEVDVLPQRAPLHVQYPAFPAARACVGLSSICQYNKLMQTSHNWLTVSTERIQSNEDIDPKAYQKTFGYVVEAVGNRVCLDHLLLFEDMGAVESYRLFSAAIADLRFRRLRDLIFAVCLMGDLVFALLKCEAIKAKLHPISGQILEAIAPSLERYQTAISKCDAGQLPTHGSSLAAQIMDALIPFLPLKSNEEPAKPTMGKRPCKTGNKVGITKKVPKLNGDDLSMPLLGTDEVVPPSIDDPSDLQLRPNPTMPATLDTPGRSSDPKSSTQSDNRLPAEGDRLSDRQLKEHILPAAVHILAQATGKEAWHDPRVDQVADAMRRNPFKSGVIEAELTGRRYKVQVIGSDREGTLREEVLSRCRQKDVTNRIRKGAAEICKKLHRFRWFGEREDLLANQFQVCGSFDPRRLYKLGISEIIRRRWLKRSVTDYRGRPVVVLAKDGSSSNSIETTFAGQILTAAFLRIEKIARIQVVAADYSSSLLGFSCLLVRWLYHPQKTPRTSPLAAADAVAGLPPKGQGGNEDVLSVSHIMQETFSALGKDQTYVVINITDAKFNSPIDQVKKMVAKLRKDYNLTYSLVVLGDTKVDIPEADHIVRIPQSELTNPHLIAERIAKHVNILVRARRGKRNSRYG